MVHGPFFCGLAGDAPTGWVVARERCCGLLYALFLHTPLGALCGTGVVTHFTPQECGPVGESVVHSIQEHKTSKEKEYTNVYRCFSY